jgi:hypothetical protein
MAVSLARPLRGRILRALPVGNPPAHNNPICQISKIFLSLGMAKFFL